MVRFSYSKPSAVACTGFGGEPNEEKAELPGNEASLNFVSLRSLCNFVGRLGPSRVKINALLAPLTALPVRGGCVCVFQFLVCFSLDRADAFIDGHRNLLLRYRQKEYKPIKK